MRLYSFEYAADPGFSEIDTPTPVCWFAVILSPFFHGKFLLLLIFHCRGIASPRRMDTLPSHERGVPLRILTLLLILLCLPCPALCEGPSERLAQLDIFRQHDPRFDSGQYRYNGYAFRSGGCSPSSITNGLTALFAQPGDDAAPLLYEIICGLTPASHHHDQPIRIAGLPDLLSAPGEDQPELARLLSGVSSVRAFSSDETLTPLMRQRDPDGQLLICTAYPLKANWKKLASFVLELNRQGLTDARIVLARVSVGTADTLAPFSSGSSGHFVSLYLDPAEFQADGTLYLLDSLPRALRGETYGNNQLYAAAYPFTRYPRSGFSTTYEASRVTDEILRVTLKDEARAAISGNISYTEWLNLRQHQLEQLGFYGNAILMIYLP